MAFFAALSSHPDPATSAGEALGQLSERLKEAPDLVVVFASGLHAAALEDIVPTVKEVLDPGTTVGVAASGVMGGTEEVERGSALSIWAGHTGPVEAARLDYLAGADQPIVGLPPDLEPGSTLMLVADPFSFPVDALISQLASDTPDVAVVGGLASAANAPGGNRLWLNQTEYRDGAIAVILPPGVAHPVVSQGCRPIGSPWVITAGGGQLIEELGSQPAMTRLESTIEDLSDADRRLAARGLQVGLVANPQQEEFTRGDFLIRGVIGRSEDSIAVGSEVTVGEVVQFHVRDAASARADLQAQLGGREAPALVFSCSLRGSTMFGAPHHDAGVIGGNAADPALAGMFCAGEIGPVGARNAVHTFTATMLLFGL